MEQVTLEQEERNRTARYIEQQLFQLAPLPIDDKHFPHGFDIQIRCESGKTNWIKLTPAQYKEIEYQLRSVMYMNTTVF